MLYDSQTLDVLSFDIVSYSHCTRIHVAQRAIFIDIVDIYDGNDHQKSLEGSS